MAEKRLKGVIKRDIENSMTAEYGSIGFNPPMFWLRGDCRIEGDAILLDVDACEMYLPSSTNILHALLCLDWPLTEKTIKKFVAEYGLLRNGIVDNRLPTHPQIEWQKDLFVTPHKDDFSQENVDNRVLEESLGVWRSDVGNLLETTELFYYLRRAVTGDNNALGHLRARCVLEEEINDFELRRRVSQYVAGAVNLGLWGCSPRVIAAVDVSCHKIQGVDVAFADPQGIRRDSNNQGFLKQYGDAGVFYMSYYSRSLVTSAWHDLACRITMNQEFHRCDNEKCGAFFSGRRPNSKFCSNRCNSYVRQVRHRQKNKAK